MAVEELKVVKCDKCGRLQEEATAEYVEFEGSVTYVKNQNYMTKDKRTDLLPKSRKPVTIINNIAYGPTTTLCLTCTRSILEEE